MVCCSSWLIPCFAGAVGHLQCHGQRKRHRFLFQGRNTETGGSPSAPTNICVHQITPFLIGSQRTFQVLRRFLPLQQPLPYRSSEIFGWKGVCKHKIPNLVGTGLRNELALGLVPCRIDFFLHFYLPFSVISASEPRWKLFHQNVFGPAPSLVGCKGDTWERLFQFLF